jgi:hypothetical protein
MRKIVRSNKNATEGWARKRPRPEFHRPMPSPKYKRKKEKVPGPTIYPRHPTRGMRLIRFKKRGG